ncbi:hypothetical protein Y032_0006g3158 [Ancylostoma ceylanicum]|nr:hypothetical protein Y032_0006g3158 [Ancylostoma ceylanicum]
MRRSKQVRGVPIKRIDSKAIPRNMLRLILFVTLAVMAHGQILRQCRCAEIEHCTSVSSQTVLECADQCQRYAGKSGASYPALRRCYEEMSGPLNSIIQCVKGQLSNSCARYQNPILVRQFHPELFKLSLLRAINEQLRMTGIQHQMAQFYINDKDYSECRLKCMSDRTIGCMRNRNCGLDLPNNEILIQLLKQCAFASGMGTEGFRQLCRCTARAGARGLAQVCERIIVM